MKKYLLSLFFAVSLTACAFAQGKESQLLAYAAPSVDGQPDAPQVKFYPNPVKRILNVRFPERGTHTVRIYNIVGDMMTQKTVLDDFIVELDLVDFPRGMFFMSYEQGGKVITKTFSKN